MLKYDTARGEQVIECDNPGCNVTERCKAQPDQAIDFDEWEVVNRNETYCPTHAEQTTAPW